MDTQYEKTGDVSKRLDIHSNTVRNYADRFSEFMSDKATGAKRKFTHDDILILATITEFRERGQSWDDIKEALSNGQRVESIPTLPSPAEELARESIALVPKTETDRLQDELRRITAERDSLLDRLENIMGIASQERSDLIEQWRNEVNERDSRIKELESELGLVKGKLSANLPLVVWLALFITILMALFFIALLVVWNLG